MRCSSCSNSIFSIKAPILKWFASLSAPSKAFVESILRATSNALDALSCSKRLLNKLRDALSYADSDSARISESWKDVGSNCDNRSFALIMFASLCAVLVSPGTRGSCKGAAVMTGRADPDGTTGSTVSAQTIHCTSFAAKLTENSQKISDPFLSFDASNIGVHEPPKSGENTLRIPSESYVASARSSVNPIQASCAAEDKHTRVSISLFPDEN
mmetsp:Transcript_13331/g.26575  ORF Transcript_13331/g.26575 Transcript_13331/m.26575 type:complete len:214 (-) Transcript_13331:82-723(-)